MKCELLFLDGTKRLLWPSPRETGGTACLDGWRQPSFGWHEPDEARGSRPDLWQARGEIPGPTRQQETEPSPTGLRRRRESFVSGHRETTAAAPVLDSTHH